MIHRKCKKRIFELESNLEKLIAEKNKLENELKVCQDKLEDAIVSKQLAEANTNSYRRTIEELGAIVKDEDTKIIEVLSRCEPEVIKLYNLPVISISLLIKVDYRLPTRRISRLVSSLSVVINHKLKDLVVAPSVTTKYDYEETMYTVSITGKYRGRFEDCCGLFHAFLVNYGLRDVTTVSMDPIEKSVIYVCVLKY